MLTIGVRRSAVAPPNSATHGRTSSDRELDQATPVAVGAHLVVSLAGVGAVTDAAGAVAARPSCRCNRLAPWAHLAGSRSRTAQHSTAQHSTYTMPRSAAWSSAGSRPECRCRLLRGRGGSSGERHAFPQVIRHKVGGSIGSCRCGTQLPGPTASSGRRTTQGPMNRPPRTEPRRSVPPSRGPSRSLDCIGPVQ